MFVDDKSIPDDSEIWRRIHPDQLTEKGGRLRPSSAAFEDSDENSPMSVHLAEVIRRARIAPEILLLGKAYGTGLASIKVRTFRQDGQSIVRDPTADDPSHALICGPKPGSVRKKWAREAVWVIEPPVPPRLVSAPAAT